MSCAVQRKAWTVMMPKPADGSSSAERSISVKQEKKRGKAMLMPHPKQEKSRGNNARVEFKTGERELSSRIVSRRKGGIEELLVEERSVRAASPAERHRGKFRFDRDARGRSLKSDASNVVAWRPTINQCLRATKTRVAEDTRHGSKKVCGCDGWQWVSSWQDARIKLEQRALFGRV
ncbi:hypothetical protein M431DRAFT_407459 [Trichoderma harzianum CBS 226.95]|uniref:Uncharacterized protein n=1 Tax=Trichoderma harzianum CBS 226.95 TaxID=983964 RepID=A0A2T4AF66_TRIHA|nr:hypothetical protein M431DRAFT_407459 [Trichoderma harzianum CBS 226.95]PTB55717.1 hypothetical protein M431DRAFT_407459 [Trichoderma harzianum CBS 226.95]